MASKKARTSYYKQIEGSKYDRSLLELAEKHATSGGVISEPEAKEIFENAWDGHGVTHTEKRTLEYILKTMKMTEKARKWLENSVKGLADTLEPDPDDEKGKDLFEADAKRIAALEDELVAMKKARDKAESELTAFKKASEEDAKTIATLQEKLASVRVDDVGASAVESEATVNVPNGSTPMEVDAVSAGPATGEEGTILDVAVERNDDNEKPTDETAKSMPELVTLLKRCEEEVKTLELTTRELTREKNSELWLVNPEAQWQALPDHLHLLGECFKRNSEALAVTKSCLERLSECLGNIEDGIVTEELLERLHAIKDICTVALEELHQVKGAGLLSSTEKRLDSPLRLIPTSGKCGSDDRVLQAWDSRLRWEATLASVEQRSWIEFGSIVAHLDAMNQAEDPQALETVLPATAKGNTPSAAVGKGKGPPVPAGRGKGPVPPKGTGKGKGEPIQRDGSNEEQTSPVMQAAQEHEKQNLFGTQIRMPHREMLSPIKREAPTFVDKLQEEQSSGRVASIDNAFGGRGRLLIHACVRKKSEGTSADKDTKGVLTVEKVKLIEIINDEKRRLALELRFHKISPQLANGVAHAINSLDFNTDCFDADSFLPSITIKLDKKQDDKETAKIRKAFLQTEEEEDQLRSVEAAGNVEQLHSLEKRLLPLVHVTGFIEKVKLFRVHSIYKQKAEDVRGQIQRAKNACDRMKASPCLFDLLHVTLQIANYVQAFGSIDFQSKGFSLLDLHKYEVFNIGGSHSFVLVLCAYLRNLRPRKAGDKKWTTGPDFLQNLDAELEEPRYILGNWGPQKPDGGTSKADLELEVAALQDMVKFVEGHCLNECALFESRDGHPRFNDLSAWSLGRHSLQILLEELKEEHASLCTALEELRASEQHLKEFAALKPDDLKEKDYIEVFYSVLQFVDKLKRTSNELQQHPKQLNELSTMLLQAAPLHIFLEHSLAHAFDLWALKAGAKDGAAQTWNEGQKREAIENLFSLFDTDASGALDAAEMRVSLQALGVQLPHDALGVRLPSDNKKYYEIVRLFDENNNGRLELAEFQILVEGGIKVTFEEFLKGDRGDAPKDMIVQADLVRIATQLGKSHVDTGRMICFLDKTEQDGKVNLSEFQQLILMRPATKYLREYDILNRAWGDDGR